MLRFDLNQLKFEDPACQDLPIGKSYYFQPMEVHNQEVNFFSDWFSF